MLSGVKFIPRDEVNLASPLEHDSGSDSLRKERSKSTRKLKHKSKKKRAHYHSSDDEGSERKNKRSNKYSSDASLLSISHTECESTSDSGEEGSRKQKGKTRVTHKREDIKKRLKRKKKCDDFSEDSFSASSESDSRDCFSGKEDVKGGRKHRREESKKQGYRKSLEENDSSADDRVVGSPLHADNLLARKELGLEWMFKPLNQTDRNPKQTDDPPEAPHVEEVKKPNPRELNPYLKDDGTGYPEDSSQAEAGPNQLLPSSVVGDGGASWRLKALKRAREQAAREGRKLDEVVEERWGSLGQLAVSVASRTTASAHAHLHAIKDRRRGQIESYENPADNQTKGIDRARGESRERFRDVSSRRSQMKEPKVHDSLSWGKKKSQRMSEEDARLISEAASNLNKFGNDGNFLHEFNLQQMKNVDATGGSSRINVEGNEDLYSGAFSQTNKSMEGHSGSKQGLSANQLAAKVLQLRMKGKHEEAERLLKESETTNVEKDDSAEPLNQGMMGSTVRYGGRDITSHQKKKEDDADMHLAKKIIQNKQYSMIGRADDEYDFDDAPSKKHNRKKGGVHEQKSEKNVISKRLLTQQERCQFCFENPSRPIHLVVSIANFTYLMLPQWQPVVQGHCCILTLQHEPATTSVDNNVWEEIRNFKKCLIMMFSKQDKEVIFLETVMGLAQQRRHCMVECIPLPCKIAKQAPLYFKKAIDEAEEEWSQHNAKKLIRTSEKGVRGSIPKGFPYFHVEFGLKDGYAHVIDDEKQFRSNLGLNVIRGMLRLPVEDMHGRRKQESVETQKQAVANFERVWQPFDWTKQLH